MWCFVKCVSEYVILFCLLNTHQLCTPCAPPVTFQVNFDCTVHLSLQIRYSGITKHWPIYPSITCKIFLHHSQKFSIFRPNTTVYHTKLLCLDWIYHTSDYTESTTGMNCPKITFFHPKCQYVILKSLSVTCAYCHSVGNLHR